MRRLDLLAIAIFFFVAFNSAIAQEYDADAALAVSQAAVGNTLADLELTTIDNRLVRLSDYRGEPLLISLIFTSCHHVCPAITRHLETAVEAARDALGDESFRIVTIGFDTANDTPLAMRSFARAQGIDDERWDFLSGSPETITALVENVGFVYFPSPRGFDHINQLTIADRDGVIYSQVYGGAFELPWMVEPLKELVFNRPQSSGHMVAGLLDRVRLFCTVYDPNTGRYRFDYSLFVQIGVGALVVGAVFTYLVVEARRARRRKKGQAEK